MKHPTQKLVICLAAILASAMLPASVSAAPAQTGIQGQAFLYINFGIPIEVEPGVWIGIPAVQMPVATSFTITSSHNGRELGRVTTDANGFFSVALVPGRYVVVPDALNLHQFFACGTYTVPFEVTVRARQMTQANIFYYRNGPCGVIAPPPVIVHGDESPE